jgi:large subunit ribosomal protein L28
VGHCELTGKRPVVKNLVSHSNIKTKSTASPNIQKKRMFSSLLGELVTLRLATSTIRTIQHLGGLDKFILNSEDKVMSSRALDIKRRIRRSMKSSKKTT